MNEWRLWGAFEMILAPLELNCESVRHSYFAQDRCITFNSVCLFVSFLFFYLGGGGGGKEIGTN